MIRFGNLRWRNLLSTGNQFSEVDLSAPGTTLVVGPNGGGKSTLTDALSFCLYGKPFRKVSKNQLVNSINRKDMLVECEFQVAGRNYMVRRGMKPTVFEIYVDGELLNMEGKTADQQEHLEKNILRINYRALMQVVVLGSASYVPFMELPAQHRREVLEDLLDMKVLGVMMDILKPMIQDVNAAMKEADHRRDILTERIDMRRKFDAAVRQDVEQRRKDHLDRIKDYQDSIDRLTEQGRQLFLRHVELGNLLDDTDYDSKLAVIRNDLSLHSAELAKMRTRLTFFDTNQVCPHCDQEVDAAHRERIERELKAAMDELSAKVAQEVDRLAELKTKGDATAKVKSEMADLRVKMTDIKSKIEHLKTNVEHETRRMTAVSSSIPSIDIPEVPTLEADLKALDDERQELYRRRTVLGSIHTVLQDDGAKARIIGTYIPMINELINGFLRDLDFFVEFELDSEFNETIKSRFRDEFTYSSFSEGEKMRINLAILFTWRAVARAKNSAATNVVIMDEIFDSSLDPAGAEELMRLLNRITGDSSVYIISHRTDQISDKFGRVLRFGKVGNFSVLDTV